MLPGRNPLPTEAQTSVVGNHKQYRQVLEDIDWGRKNRRNVFAQLSTLGTLKWDKIPTDTGWRKPKIESNSSL
jgi:hypothetical protein